MVIINGQNCDEIRENSRNMLAASQSRKSTFQSTGATWEDLRKEVYSPYIFSIYFLLKIVDITKNIYFHISFIPTGETSRESNRCETHRIE